jgi:hypothetical protein
VARFSLTEQALAFAVVSALNKQIRLDVLFKSLERLGVFVHLPNPAGVTLTKM